MDHICIIWLTHKQARARKVPYGSRCGNPATEFFQANLRAGKPVKSCRCAEHAVSMDKDIARKGSFYVRITQEEYETEQL